MSSITLNGTFHRPGATPLVFITTADRPKLTLWWAENGVSTKLLAQNNPISGSRESVIYVTDNAVAGIAEGSAVHIVLDLSVNGIKTVEVIPIQ